MEFIVPLTSIVQMGVPTTVRPIGIFNSEKSIAWSSPLPFDSNEGFKVNGWQSINGVVGPGSSKNEVVELTNAKSAISF
ncbi:MAG: hypothetical protein BWY67_01164 [Bacteroidetes bacterium ADurb.Bin397]|nr:MAG: hypothetical protein BWY67_01164 [Bacteroidetes bacterium ADurb.Bin397]